MKINVRLIYLYLFSFVGLLTIVIGSVRLVDLSLKTLVFKDADKYESYMPKSVDNNSKDIDFDEKKSQEIADKEQKRTRQRDLSNALAMVAVGLPLYLYHWKTIQKENKIV